MSWCGLGVYIVFLLFLLVGFGFAGQGEVIIAARKFFSALNRRDYETAYFRLTRKLRLEVSLEEFKTTAESIEGVRVLRFEIKENYSRLVRIVLKARVFLWYEGELYDAIYEGKATLIKERNFWKLDACELEPTRQEKAKSGKELKKIEFRAN